MNSSRRKLGLLLLAIFASGSSINFSASALDADAPLHVFLLTGQSNMAGRAAIESQDEKPVEGALLWNIVDQKWEDAKPPYNRYSPHNKGPAMQRLNCGPSFVRDYLKANPGVRVGIVCSVRGGTSIEQWEKGVTKPWSLFDTTVAEAEAALAADPKAELKGMLWHQGEANSAAEKVDKYPAQLKQMIADFRADLKSPDLPFVFAQIGQFNEGYADFNKMIVEQPENIENTACVVTDRLKNMDKAHFDSAGQRLLGKRYAEAMLKLLAEKKG
jgi:hypothetical protein